MYDDVNFKKFEKACGFTLFPVSRDLLCPGNWCTRYTEFLSTSSSLVTFFLTLSVFYRNVKKYHKLRGIRQHPLTNSQFCRAEVQAGLAASPGWLRCLLRVWQG